MFIGPTVVLGKRSPSLWFFKLIFPITANSLADRKPNRPRSLLGICPNLLFRFLDLQVPRDSLQSQDEVFVPDPHRIWILTFLIPSSFQHLMSLQPESSPQLWLHRTQHLTWPFDFNPFWVNSAHPENSTEAKMECAGIEERYFLLGSVGPTSNSVCLSVCLTLSLSLRFSP